MYTQYPIAIKVNGCPTGARGYVASQMDDWSGLSGAALWTSSDKKVRAITSCYGQGITKLAPMDKATFNFVMKWRK